MGFGGETPRPRRTIPGRAETALGAFVLVAATILVTEWMHYRIGDPTLWSWVRTDPDDLVPDSEAEGTDGGVTEADFERYLEVLEAMQADHALSIDGAAESQRLTLGQFRDIEQRVQRDEGLVHRAREHLRKQAETLWDSRRAKLEQG